MNFYIGDSINEINAADTNVEFSDELIDFIYKISKNLSVDMSKLSEIDPYDDVKIPKNNLPGIIKICNYILDKSLILNFEEPDEAIQMINNLIEIAQDAISKNLGLISIGD